MREPLPQRSGLRVSVKALTQQIVANASYHRTNRQRASTPDVNGAIPPSRAPPLEVWPQETSSNPRGMCRRPTVIPCHVDGIGRERARAIPRRKVLLLYLVYLLLQLGLWSSLHTFLIRTRAPHYTVLRHLPVYSHTLSFSSVHTSVVYCPTEVCSHDIYSLRTMY